MMISLPYDKRPAVERVPELKAAWETLLQLEAILTAAQANRAQRIVQGTGVRRRP